MKTYEQRFIGISSMLNKLELSSEHVVNPVDLNETKIASRQACQLFINILFQEPEIIDKDMLASVLRQDWDDYSVLLASGDEEGMFIIFDLLRYYGIEAPSGIDGLLWSGEAGREQALNASQAMPGRYLMEQVSLTRVLTKFYESFEFVKDYHPRVWGIMSAFFVSGLKSAEYFCTPLSEDETKVDVIANSFFMAVEKATMTIFSVKAINQPDFFHLQNRGCPMTGATYHGVEGDEPKSGVSAKLIKQTSSFWRQESICGEQAVPPIKFSTVGQCLFNVVRSATAANQKSGTHETTNVLDNEVNTNTTTSSCTG